MLIYPSPEEFKLQTEPMDSFSTCPAHRYTCNVARCHSKQITKLISTETGFKGIHTSLDSLPDREYWVRRRQLVSLADI